MLDSVPSLVTLSPPIELIQTKVSDALLTVEHDELVFKVTLRVSCQRLPFSCFITNTLQARSEDWDNSGQRPDGHSILV